MKNTNETSTQLESYIDTLQKEMPKIREEYKVKNLSVFGSYIHHKDDETSDLDLLVEFNQTPTLFQFIRLENYLSDLLGVNVDLVMKDSLKPEIGKHVLNEAQEISFPRSRQKEITKYR